MIWALQVAQVRCQTLSETQFPYPPLTDVGIGFGLHSVITVPLLSGLSDKHAHGAQ